MRQRTLQLAKSIKTDDVQIPRSKMRLMADSKCEFLEDIVKMTVEMRRWQKLYFKSRDREHLMEAKRIEKNLDKKLSQYIDKSYVQRKLFS